MRNALERYGVGIKEEDVYDLRNNPTSMEVNRVLIGLKKRIQSNPLENFLIIYVLAGRGMCDDGRQIVLLNEYDFNNKFYKQWGVEAEIADISKFYPNTYQMAFFGCSREFKNDSKHTNCISKPIPN